MPFGRKYPPVKYMHLLNLYLIFSMQSCFFQYTITNPTVHVQNPPYGSPVCLSIITCTYLILASLPLREGMHEALIAQKVELCFSWLKETLQGQELKGVKSLQKIPFRRRKIVHITKNTCTHLVVSTRNGKRAKSGCVLMEKRGRWHAHIVFPFNRPPQL